MTIIQHPILKKKEQTEAVTNLNCVAADSIQEKNIDANNFVTNCTEPIDHLQNIEAIKPEKATSRDQARLQSKGTTTFKNSL